MPDYFYVSTQPRIQVLDQDGYVAFDFFEDAKIAQKIAWKLNISHWSEKEPKYAG